MSESVGTRYEETGGDPAFITNGWESESVRSDSEGDSPGSLVNFIDDEVIPDSQSEGDMVCQPGGVRDDDARKRKRKHSVIEEPEAETRSRGGVRRRLFPPIDAGKVREAFGEIKDRLAWLEVWFDVAETEYGRSDGLASPVKFD
ncbi:hypothetical protein CEP51_016868, partial [Fusarium floridanum]